MCVAEGGVGSRNPQRCYVTKHLVCCMDSLAAEILCHQTLGMLHRLISLGCEERSSRFLGDPVHSTTKAFIIFIIFERRCFDMIPLFIDDV